MKNILIHGLGQNNQSWNNISIYLKKQGIDTVCPNLFKMTKNTSTNYKEMRAAFFNFCNNQKTKLNLCGLSLGGILVLDFVKQYPEKVNSIILIGTPYKIPQVWLKLQSLIFNIMPKKVFEKMNCSKQKMITLVNSMSNLDITKDLETIKCKTLIICGIKDKANLRSSGLLNKYIKNSQFIVISNSSHQVNIDNPKELGSIIYEFWKDKQ